MWNFWNFCHFFPLVEVLGPHSGLWLWKNRQCATTQIPKFYKNGCRIMWVNIYLSLFCQSESIRWIIKWQFLSILGQNEKNEKKNASCMGSKLDIKFSNKRSGPNEPVITKIWHWAINNRYFFWFPIYFCNREALQEAHSGTAGAIAIPTQMKKNNKKV